MRMYLASCDLCTYDGKKVLWTKAYGLKSMLFTTANHDFAFLRRTFAHALEHLHSF